MYTNYTHFETRQFTCAWFLKIAFYPQMSVCMCVCVSAPNSTTNY